MKLTHVLAPLLVAGLAFGSAACTKGDDGGTATSSRTTEATAKSTEKTGGVDDDGHVSSPADLAKVPGLDDAKGIRSDAEMNDCDTGPGKVAAAGTVANRSDEPTDILVTVNWINAKYDVVARGVEVIEAVEPGKSVDWEVTATLGEGYGEVSCVLNVKRGEVTTDG